MHLVSEVVALIDGECARKRSRSEGPLPGKEEANRPCDSSYGGPSTGDGECLVQSVGGLLRRILAASAGEALATEEGTHMRVKIICRESFEECLMPKGLAPFGPGDGKARDEGGRVFYGLFASNSFLGGAPRFYRQALCDELIPLFSTDEPPLSSAAPSHSPAAGCILIDAAQDDSDRLWYSFSPPKGQEAPDWLAVVALVAAPDAATSSPFLGGGAHSSRHVVDTFFSTTTEDCINAINAAFVNDSFHIVEGALLDSQAVGLLSELVARLSSCTEEDVAGPLDYRHYVQLCNDEDGPSPFGKDSSSSSGDGGPLRSSLGAFINDTLKSDAFRLLIADMTGLSLFGIAALEVRALGLGDFSILNGNYKEPLGLDVVISLLDAGKDGIPTVTYLSDGQEVATIPPGHNTMALAYRVGDCERFIRFAPTPSPSLLGGGGGGGGGAAGHAFQFCITFAVNDNDPLSDQ